MAGEEFAVSVVAGCLAYIARKNWYSFRKFRGNYYVYGQILESCAKSGSIFPSF
jgi:hypothetical protein